MIEIWSKTFMKIADLGRMKYIVYMYKYIYIFVLEK